MLLYCRVMFMLIVCHEIIEIIRVLCVLCVPAILQEVPARRRLRDPRLCHRAHGGSPSLAAQCQSHRALAADCCLFFTCFCFLSGIKYQIDEAGYFLFLHAVSLQFISPHFPHTSTFDLITEAQQDMTAIYRFIISIIIGCVCQTVSSFELDRHREITQALLEESFPLGGTSVSFTQDALDDVKEGNVDTDIFGFYFDYYHFDNEQFYKASEKILNNLKEAESYLLEWPPNGYKARKSFGSAVHTLQDFYSHSTWANLHTNYEDIHPDVGRKLVANPPKGKKFCDSTAAGLLPGVTELTSGYYEFIQYPPPYLTPNSLTALILPRESATMDSKGSHLCQTVCIDLELAKTIRTYGFTTEQKAKQSK
jgi:hypothetical protein